MRGAAVVLRDAFSILEREAPAASSRVAREIAGLTLRIEVDGEVFRLCGDADGIRFVATRGPADVDVRCDRTTILALIDGRSPVMDCVLAGRLSIQGDVDLMPALSRASVSFAEGAVRSRAMRDLLETFRRETTTAVESCSRSSPPGSGGTAKRASS